MLAFDAVLFLAVGSRGRGWHEPERERETVRVCSGSFFFSFVLVLLIYIYVFIFAGREGGAFNYHQRSKIVVINISKIKLIKQY